MEDATKYEEVQTVITAERQLDNKTKSALEILYFTLGKKNQTKKVEEDVEEMEEERETVTLDELVKRVTEIEKLTVTMLGSREINSYGTRKTPKTTTTCFPFKFCKNGLHYSNFSRYSPR